MLTPLHVPISSQISSYLMLFNEIILLLCDKITKDRLYFSNPAYLLTLNFSILASISALSPMSASIRIVPWKIVLYVLTGNRLVVAVDVAKGIHKFIN